MKKKFFYPSLIFAVLYSFLFGILVSWLYFRYFSSEPVTPVIPPINSKAQLREEYDVVIASEESPHTVLFLDYIVENDQIYGFAHYYSDTSWKVTPLNEGDISLKDADGLNQFVTSISGEFTIGDATFKVDIPRVYTPVVIRAEKAYVKFGGTTTLAGDYLAINGEPTKSYAAVLKGYNHDIFTLDVEEYGVTTDWLMYWDNNWTFYHLDKTTVEKEHPIYTSHSYLSMFSLLDLDTYGSATYFVDPTVLKVGNKVTVSAIQRPRLLEVVLGPSYERGYGGISYAALAESIEGGIGVYLHVGN